MTMYPALADAIAAKDFSKVDAMLAVIAADAPDNPWLDYYRARVAEEKGELNHAEHSFRKLLPIVSNPKLLAKIRRGLDRIQAHHDGERQQFLDQRQSELEAAKAVSGADAMAIFVLEPMAAEAKQACAVQFGKIMQLDAYSARLQLPSRSWRLYRTGGIGELNYYQQQCATAGIPSFCIPLAALQSPTVYPVYSLNKITPAATMCYRVSRDTRELFQFSWNAVSAWVEGQLPIFEESLEKDVRGKPQRKITILDYAKVCDLHLPSQGMIIRFCDQTYEFNRGIDLLPATNVREQAKATSHQQWQVLMTRLQEQLGDRHRWTDFKAFAETALDFQELLKTLDSHIYFLRREPTLWDQAFHLYSTLIYCRSQR